MGVRMKNIAVLNSLIETLKDGQEGFRSASEDVDVSELKAVFSKYSLERGQLAGELQALAHSLGESEPEDSGSTAGALHRGWIDLKSALVTRNAHAILAECERGEDAAVAAYREALEETEISSYVRSVLDAQYAKVKAAHDHIRSLRDATAPAA
jgi:uncharacterized protein (TIGR02284 family)